MNGPASNKSLLDKQDVCKATLNEVSLSFSPTVSLSIIN